MPDQPDDPDFNALDDEDAPYELDAALAAAGGDDAFAHDFATAPSADPSDVEAIRDSARNPNAPLSSDNTPPLLLAARLGETAVLKSLLARGADPLAADAEGWTALHWAVHERQTPAVEVLLETIHVDAPDAAGNTPLLLTAEAGETDLLRLLLARGAAVDAVNEDGLGALALAGLGGHVDALQILLDAGAPIQMTDERNRAALTWAAQRGHITWATLNQERPEQDT